MLQRMIDDVRAGLGNSLRLTGLAAATAFALFIAVSFFCAAAFMFVLLRVRSHIGQISNCSWLSGVGRAIRAEALAAAKRS